MVFCTNCGSDNSDGAKFCFKCSNSMEHQEKFEGEYASLGIRLVSIIIDGILINIIVLILAILISIPLTNQETTIGILYYIIDLIVFVCYFTILEGPFNNGQTIGKKITSIQVVKTNKETTTYTQSFIRTLLRIIDMIPLIIPYLVGAICIHTSDKNQRIGDIGAKTIVIKKNK